jgi:hypothetical protein
MISKQVGRIGALVQLLLVIPGIATGQQDSRLSEREEVTAVDLVIELTRDGSTAIEPPDDLRPGDFVVERDGEPVAVVGVASGAELEPWHLTIYFDHLLSSTASLRWSASALADRAATLVDLGYVEIVAADPEPRRLLAPTRDADLVDQVLSGVFLEAEADNAVLAQREEFLLQRERELDLRSPGAVRQLIDSEVGLVTERQDALLHVGVENLPAAARRALFLVSDGFDPHPAAFYSRFGELEAAEVETLSQQTDEWLLTIAGYGWTVIPVMIPEGEAIERYGAVPDGTERTWGFRLPGIARRLEGSLDPQRAAAEHELGQKLAEQGALDEAAESLTEALSLYHDHPKYTLQRAAVLADLGEVLLRLDRIDEARDALREAVRLDPGKEREYPLVQARVESAAEIMERLAVASAGWVVTNGEDLASVMASMARSMRLTFQFRGQPDGGVHGIEVRVPGLNLDVRAADWIRFGVPGAVSTVRARRLLRGELEEGPIALKCLFVEEATDYATRKGRVEIRMTRREDWDLLNGESVRLTLGLAAEDGSLEIRRQTIVWDGETYALPVEVRRDNVWMSVVLDDPGTGRWGGATGDL